MSVKIRLKRTGRHKDPHYKVVAVDSRKKRDGKVLEYLGHYHPQDEFPNIKVDIDSFEKWVDNGAKVSDTVNTMVAKLRKATTKEEK
ncbi:MAG: 30S ribosomal protein S16 [Elusimicrobiota bacterium]